MHNLCTRVDCGSNAKTTAMLGDDNRAWAHLCPRCLNAYAAEMGAANQADPCSEKSRPITVKYAGGEQAWRCYVFGPFGGASSRRQRKVLAGTEERSE